MSEERFQQRKLELTMAVGRLEEALREPESDLVRDAVIQRFEFSFELFWKALKLYLEKQGIAVETPRAALKKAFQLGLMAGSVEADVWLNMLEDRNLTSHTYHQVLAEQIYHRIRSEYGPLLKDASARIAELRWT